MKTWHDFYLERMNDNYRRHIERRYAPFIDKIITIAGKQNALYIAEMGCGAANVSRIIKKYYTTGIHMLVDKCPKMLDLAKQNMNGEKDVFFFTADITDGDLRKALDLPILGPPPRIDLIHAHGVLEHFDNETIRKIIKLQLEMSPIAIHYVPSSKYEKPSFGDERLMSPAQWDQIAKPTSIEFFNDGYDLILTWERDKL